MLLQGDLTEENDSNLYVNPLEATEKCGRVKKSISGEVGRNIISDTSPSVESLKDIRPSKEISKINLNDTIPKHRKIRIQQVSLLMIFYNLYPERAVLIISIHSMQLLVCDMWYYINEMNEMTTYEKNRKIQLMNR